MNGGPGHELIDLEVALADVRTALRERDQRYEDRFRSQDAATTLAFAAAEKAVKRSAGRGGEGSGQGLYVPEIHRRRFL